MNLLILWFIMGIIGFFLYCSNKKIRPKKISLLVASFLTHLIFGLISLFYGFVCFSGRNN